MIRRARPSHILGTLVAATLALALLGACLGEVTAPKRVYYAVDYPRGDEVVRYHKPRYDFTLRVQRFDSSLAYDRQEIVYRTSPYEINYYAYRLWTAKPRKMLTQLVLSHLEQTMMFRAVVDRVTDEIPRYALNCEVLAIEELDASATQWFARLSMRFWLTRTEDGARVWSYEFDERTPVHERKPVFVVRAISEILEQEMRKIVGQLDAYLAEETGAPVPEGGRLDVVQGPASSGPGAGEGPSKASAEGDGPEVDPNEPSARLKKKN